MPQRNGPRLGELGSDTRRPSSPSHPLQFVLVALASSFNQQRRDVIDYLLKRTASCVKRSAAGVCANTDDKRRRHAAKAGHSATTSVKSRVFGKFQRRMLIRRARVRVAFLYRFRSSSVKLNAAQGRTKRKLARS